MYAGFCRSHYLLMSIQKPYSEETGRLIDEEVRSLVNKAYQRTKELLQQNQGSLKSVAELLLKKETIFKEDLEAILGKRPDEKAGSGGSEGKACNRCL
jgi:AFG3 family protein